ncbi:TetR/AcrR family transcriptional regulator, partial [Tsukamurella pulmonis]
APRPLLPFRLVESVIGLRSDGAVSPGREDALVDAICEAIRRVLV